MNRLEFLKRILSFIVGPTIFAANIKNWASGVNIPHNNVYTFRLKYDGPTFYCGRKMAKELQKLYYKNSGVIVMKNGVTL